MKRDLYLAIGLMVTAFMWFAAPAFAAHEKTAEERIHTLSARIEALEEELAENGSPLDWIENVAISGLIEAEAAYTKYEPAAAGLQDKEASDIVLSTLEIGIDTDVNNHISGHVLFLWEEDSSEPVDVDEIFISISGGEALPAYLRAGKFYVPFGRYESFFITDPLALELGETRESAVLAGYQTGTVDFSAGAFNGDVDEFGDSDHIDSFFAAADYTLPEKAMPDVGFRIGMSYISNIADSDVLEAENDINGDGAPDGIHDAVGGISGYVNMDFQNRIFLIAEYAGATKSFAPGEMAFAEGKVRPRAWNAELAYVFESECGFGIKYEGASDVVDLLPETRYGLIGFCHPFEGGYLGVEYVTEQFDNGDDNTAVTAQLAYEF